MTDTKSSDRSSDPLLINHGDGKRIISGIVRNKRTGEDPATNANPLNNKRRLILFVVLIVIIIYLNAAAVYTWDDDRSSDRVSVNHRSHVPGMRARALKIISVGSTGVSTSSSSLNKNNSITKIQLPPPGYLVWSDQCKMPSLDPYTSDVMKFFKRQKYEPCSLIKPLTHTSYDPIKKLYTLHVDDEMKKYYSKIGTLNCCYQLVQRSGKDKKADEEISLGKCRTFTESELLSPKYANILVKCTNLGTEVYVNAHAMIPEQSSIRKRLDKWKDKMADKKRPLSVLMIGIDSVSRVNFIRAMPKTAQRVYDSEWFEMSGYNKIDDNTFPNLMAIFTGYNLTTANTKCNPYSVGYLDKCPIIWYDFRRNGYVTAYAEDEETISTFNYLKVGFQKPPTDFYIRPLMMAAENHLPVKKKSSLTFCLGYKHSAEYVYDYILDLATTYKDDPYYGMFWANTFSHNVISDASAMDGRMVKYLKKFEKIGIFENSMVIFFSDHGMRFGPTRQLPSGRLEERLPFFFIWLPEWFKKLHPDFVSALNINKNRLTTPYDVHMTLKHILELSGRVEKLPPATDCPNCQSLFVPVPHNRSCADAAIEEHWCTCTPYQPIERTSEQVQNVANFGVDYINEFLRTYKNGSVSPLCSKLHLKKVKYSYYAKTIIGKINAYQIAFETTPGGALFETTVHHNTETLGFEMTGSISRLNSYGTMSRCVSEGPVQKFCFCT